MERTQRRMGWKWGIPFVIVCVIIGFAVGKWGNALAATPQAPQHSVARTLATPTGCGGCTSQVPTAHKGVRKFKRHHLGHAAADMHWSGNAKRIILNKLMAKQKQLQKTGTYTTAMKRSTPLTRSQMWHLFTAHDNCFYLASGSPNTATWTCSGNADTPPPPDNADWTGQDVNAILCGGLAGIGVGGALASGVTGPWTWLGIGAGYAVCMWQGQLARYADTH